MINSLLLLFENVLTLIADYLVSSVSYIKVNFPHLGISISPKIMGWFSRYLLPALTGLRVCIFLLFLAQSCWGGEARISNINDQNFSVILLSDNRFVIPTSYLMIKPLINSENHVDSFGVAFWMPSGGPLDYNPLYHPGFGFDDETIQKKADQHYAVIVRLVTSESGPLSRPNPEVQLHNVIGGKDAARFLKSTISPNLEIYKEQVTSSNFGHYYLYGKWNDDYRYLIRCAATTLPHSSCSGDVLLEKYNIICSVQYPIQNDVDIINISERLEYLFSQWSKK